jgi:hypothetical protein
MIDECNFWVAKVAEVEQILANILIPYFQTCHACPPLFVPSVLFGIPFSAMSTIKFATILFCRFPVAKKKTITYIVSLGVYWMGGSRILGPLRILGDDIFLRLFKWAEIKHHQDWDPRVKIARP